MVKQIDDRSAADKVQQMLVFASTRALLVGLLGMAAAWIGAAFFDFSGRTMLIALGAWSVGFAVWVPPAPLASAAVR